jgi:hypothetical protein
MTIRKPWNGRDSGEGSQLSDLCLYLLYLRLYLPFLLILYQQCMYLLVSVHYGDRENWKMIEPESALAFAFT